LAVVDLDKPRFSSEILRRLLSDGRLPIADPKKFFDGLNQAFEDLHTTAFVKPFALEFTTAGDVWSMRLGRNKKCLSNPRRSNFTTEAAKLARRSRQPGERS
jgi:hypothetical protein